MPQNQPRMRLFLGRDVIWSRRCGAAVNCGRSGSRIKWMNSSKRDLCDDTYGGRCVNKMISTGPADPISAEWCAVSRGVVFGPCAFYVFETFAEERCVGASVPNASPRGPGLMLLTPTCTSVKCCNQNHVAWPAVSLPDIPEGRQKSSRSDRGWLAGFHSH